MTRFRVSIGIAILLVAFLFFSQFLLAAQSRTAGVFGAVAGYAAAAFESLFFRTNLSMKAAALELENQSLRAEISRLARQPEASWRERQYRVPLFSSYPFNHRSLLTIGAGAADGVSSGMPVTVEGNLLLGFVTEVSPHTSVARTIFDASLEIPVKIGTKGVNALLQGGREPRLALIVSEAAVAAGDEVYSTGEKFPYGIVIGEVASVVARPAAAFQEAILRIPYQLAALDAVVLLRP